MQKRTRGFLTLDVVVALALVVTLATCLAVLLNRQNLASRKLADTRTALRLAERALAQLQSGTAPPPATAESRVRLRRIDCDSPAKGMIWVEVAAQYESQHAVLIGLVPQHAAQKGGITP